MTHIGVIPKDLAIGPFWPQISDLISKAMPYGRGEYAIDDIRDGIATGGMFALGVVVDSVVQFVVTASLVEYPRKRVLYVQYGAGWGGAEAFDALKHASQTLKADWIETRCRASVARLYRRIGFDTAYQVAILETPT